MDPQAAGSERARLDGLDGLKGVAIAFVVLIHAAPVEASFYRDSVVNGAYRLAVPAFLATTGYLAGLRGSSRERLSAYFWRFLRLHLIYGAFYWGLSLALRGVQEPLTLKSALLHFGAGSYPGQYYFAILLQVFFLTGFLLPSRFWRHGAAPLLAGGLAVIGIVGLQVAVEAEPGTPLSWLARLRQNPFWLWLHYFTLGAFLGDRRRSGRLGPAPAALALPLLLAAGVVVTLDWPPFGVAELPTPFPYARLSILLGATLLVLGLPWIAERPAPAWLTRTGRGSLGIFVFNPALLALAFQVLGRPQEPLGSLLLAAATIGVGLALADLARRRAPFLLD